MTITLEAICASPDHYLHSFEGEGAVMVPMDRAAYHRSIFLDGRISPAAPGAMRLPMTMFDPDMVKTPQSASWIFHMAHCGSTLLARALDCLDGNLVLREPLALRQMGIDYDQRRAALTLALLGRRYQAGLPTVVKANVPVNFILPHLAARDPSARVLFLHCSLRDWLLQVMRSPDHRNWIDRISEQLEGHLPARDTNSLAERGAALWLAQAEAFAAALTLWPKAAMIDSERFFSGPGVGLHVAASHLGVAIDAERAAEIVAGSLFSHDAKRPDAPFDNAARLKRRAALESQLEPELSEAQLWLEKQGATGLQQDRPLI